MTPTRTPRPTPETVIVETDHPRWGAVRFVDCECGHTAPRRIRDDRAMCDYIDHRAARHNGTI